MTRLLGTLLALAMLPATLRAADDKSDARKVVDKGIEFLGGAKNLKKARNATFEEKGTYYGMGDGLPYTGEYAISRPNKFRMVIKGVFTQIINGNKGWVKMADEVKEMTKAQLKATKGQLYIDQVTQLLPLRNAKKFKLAVAGKGKVGDKAVTIVKVSSKGHPDVKLSFLANGMLARAEYKGAMEGMPEKMVTYVAYYMNYKTAGGVKYPSKMQMTREGKKFIEASITSYKPADKLDPKLFEKP